MSTRRCYCLGMKTATTNSKPAPMSKSAARAIVRDWARTLHPHRWTVDNFMCYGEGDLGRAVRVLGSEDAWAVCQTA
jgi:hypothetical protein